MKNVLKNLITLLFIFGVTGAFSAPQGDFAMGFTQQGHPFKGELDAPVVLIEYSDYLCPYCARYFTTTMPELIEKYVVTGKMRMEFRHYPLAALHPTAALGHEAAICAGEQSVGNFWQFHDALFSQQSEWNRLPDPSDFLTKLAGTFAIDDVAWSACFNKHYKQAVVEQDVANGKALEFSGTPTFQLIAKATPEAPFTIVGARPAEHFSKIVDALLAGEEPPKPPEKPKPELPAWAKSESLAEDPERLGFTVSGDPSYGDPDARLVIVEFTDYQCPACARHALETQPAIDKELIETGKVRWVSKQLPLPEHQNAMAAAAAAVCAADQGHFRDMHESLFREQENWAALDNPDPALIAIAANIKLKIKTFADCLGSRVALERVLKDVFAATNVTRATPVFLVLDGESGRPIRGARDPEQFVDLVLKHLKSVLAADTAEVGDKS